MLQIERERAIFYYYGRKARAAKSYPAPTYPLVIEPFAGSMAYTLHWRPPFAIGIEIDQEVADVWHRLASMSLDEVRAYRMPKLGQRFTDKWLMLADQTSGALDSTYRTMTWYIAERAETQRRMVLKHHDYVNNSVLYHHGDYREAPDVEATWLIDPPYQDVKHSYRHGQKAIDFEELAEWCMTRRGQVIVCEGAKGKWLAFDDHLTLQGLPMFGTAEANTKVMEKVLTRTTHARCPAPCGATFPASRSDAKYCSTKCRVRASRARKKRKLVRRYPATRPTS